jgi:hypothetical protein
MLTALLACAGTPLAPARVAPPVGDAPGVRLEASGEAGGSFVWERSAARLTDAQQAALAALRRIEGHAACPEDVQEYTLTRTGPGGVEEAVRANALNAACGPGLPLVDVASLEPLLDTLACVATGAAPAQLAGAPTVRPDDGCRHGFFSYRDGPAKWVRLEPAAGREHVLALRGCEGKATELALFDGAGTTPLASARGDGTSQAACAQLALRLDGPGPYALRVTSRAVTTGGHVLLEVTSR